MAGVSSDVKASVWAGDTALEDGVGHTARWTAAMRAIEQQQPNPIIDDPLAHAFAGQSALDKWGPEMANMHAREPGKKSHIAIRARACDDVIYEEIDAMLPAEFVQVVSLGAGFCTRPWRLSCPETDLRWFEVDRPDSMALKEKIAKAQPRGPNVSKYCHIGIDFSSPDASLTQSLEQYGFDKTAPTVFVMEGLLPYLTLEDISDLAQEIDELCQDRVQIVMTVINKGFLSEIKNPSYEETRTHPGTTQVATLFHTCWEEGIRTCFEDAGWSLVSCIAREDYATQYLGVEMLNYKFPMRSISTEYIIVMKRRQSGLLGFLENLLGIPSC